MTPLRQRMIEDMQLRNLGSETQRAYLHYITGLARFYQTSPEQLSLEEIREFQLHMINERRYSPESVNAFVACHHPNSAQHSVPFLICDRCHSAVELEDRDVVAALDARAKALGFQPQAQTLEVHGLCARCAAA